MENNFPMGTIKMQSNLIIQLDLGQTHTTGVQFVNL